MFCLRPASSGCQLHIFVVSTNEKRRYVMSSSLRQFIAGYAVAILWHYPIRCRVAFANALELEDTCIQNFHLGRYIVGYTVGNLVLRRRAREYGYPHSYALLQFCLKLERCRSHNSACHPTECNVINGVKLFRAVYSSIYCRKSLSYPIRRRVTKANA